MNIQELYNIYKSCAGASTDTRSLKTGELFFALIGENFDGHNYVFKALEAGAPYAVVNADSPVLQGVEDSRLIKVDDTLKVFQELARWHRCMTFVDSKPIIVIALTGTNGKTTTKELIREVLSTKYKVTATEGNFNNSVGVPVTLLKINSETQLAVVEMGASHPGDIKELVDIALPNYGLVTNVGKAHLLGFGSFEGVKKTKGELYDYLRRTADKVFLNVDNPHLCGMASERNLQYDPERPYSLIIPYGLEYQKAKVLPSDPENPFLRVELDGRIIKTNLVGSYNADNVMAALCVGAQFGVSFDEAVSAIEAYVPSNNRSQMTKTGRNTLIVDAYNANPTSMAAALDNFATVQADYKVAMLGDMLELGADSEAEHKVVLEKVLNSGLQKICLVGEEFGKVLGDVDSDIIEHFMTSSQLAEWAEKTQINGAVVLIKGSRGTQMENVIEKL